MVPVIVMVTVAADATGPIRTLPAIIMADSAAMIPMRFTEGAAEPPACLVNEWMDRRFRRCERNIS